MKVRTWLLVAISVVFLLALGAFYILRDVRIAQAEIDAWSKTKYPPPPPADLPIEMVGQMREWRVRYPGSRRILGDPQLLACFAGECNADREQADDVHVVNELHVWKGGTTKVFLKSADEPHSLFLPTQRLMQDVAPGKVVDLWFTATDSNVTWNSEADSWKLDDEWAFTCGEQGMRGMRGQLFVHKTKEDFLRWLKRVEQQGAGIPFRPSP